jgi:hypothetical protein
MPRFTLEGAPHLLLDACQFFSQAHPYLENRLWIRGGGSEISDFGFRIRHP